MRKFTVSLTIQLEAINSFEAVNEFEKLIIAKLISLEKYKVVELVDEPKVDPLPIIIENEI